jgi:nitrogen regulatory protein P-II 1
MKLITAIVRPEKLDELIDVVIGNGGRGLTVTEARGFGRQFGQLAHASRAGTPASVKPALLPKVRLEILVPDEDAGALLDAVAKHARTGAIGDGKAWLATVEGAMRLRTGERGRDAL